MLERPLSEEEGMSEEGESTESNEPDYNFEGFNIEFSEKIMLIPFGPVRAGKRKA